MFASVRRGSILAEVQLERRIRANDLCRDSRLRSGGVGLATMALSRPSQMPRDEVADVLCEAYAIGVGKLG